ncbi:hypothetical protein HAZT_HAZT001780 [Hyalella azteca]|uniref:Protein kinase domain-containing protein n=1 Tax=Hyalella azteca TaxID=294128 RepID=A0A6A0HE80_HYAAZ|nr:hypothetical protein HAZT_HAZT001780 [Hyalella azteca]
MYCAIASSSLISLAAAMSLLTLDLLERKCEPYRFLNVLEDWELEDHDEDALTDEQLEPQYVDDDADELERRKRGKDGNKVTTVVATAGQGSDRPQEVSYMDTKVIGNGSFGVVFQAKLVESGELVAIKKVLQDKRFKVLYSRSS